MPLMRTAVLIVGGGPVRSTLALDLASRGIDVMVAERNPPDQMRGVKCNHVAARTMDRFTPSTVPGCGTPHFWLEDGPSLYDAMGGDFCLLRFDRSIDASGLADAAAHRGVPPRVLDVAPFDPYRHKLVLSRPDQHVAWRGDAPPDNPLALVDKIRGAASPFR
jgi:hypothetical protein